VPLSRRDRCHLLLAVFLIGPLPPPGLEVDPLLAARLSPHETARRAYEYRDTGPSALGWETGELECVACQY
jgi:hypothetical protein